MTATPNRYIGPRGDRRVSDIDSRDNAKSALQGLRNAQSAGVSLKKAVRKGLAVIKLSYHEDPRQRIAIVEPRG